MRLPLNRDHLVLDDLDRPDVELHRLMDLNYGMDQMLVRLLHLGAV